MVTTVAWRDTAIGPLGNMRFGARAAELLYRQEGKSLGVNSRFAGRLELSTRRVRGLVPDPACAAIKAATVSGSAGNAAAPLVWHHSEKIRKSVP